MLKRSLSLILVILTIVAVFSVLPASAADTDVEASETSSEQVVDTSAAETQPATEQTEEADAASPETSVTEATQVTEATEASKTTEPSEQIQENYPKITSFDNKADGISLKWSAYDGAAIYRLYYLNGNGSWTRILTKNVTEYTDTDVKDGETRIYTVRACGKDGTFISDFKIDGWSYTFFAPPVIKTIESSDDGIQVTWNRVKGAQDYRLYRRSGNSAWTRIAQTDQSSCTDKTVSSGAKYTYTLRLVTSDGTSFMSSYNSGKDIIYLATPAIKKIENSSNGAVISWDKVKGAAFYRLYYRNSAGGWTRLATNSQTEYTDTSVKSGITRVYTMRCLSSNEDYISDFNRTGWHNTFHASPVIKDIENTEEGVKVTWDREKGTQDYRLYRRSGNSAWTRIAQTDQSSCTDKTVSSGAKYTYTLRLVTSDGTSFMSSYNSGKDIIYLATPAIKKIENSSNGAVISWDKVKGAAFYRLYYRNSAGGWTRLATNSQTEYTDTSVKSGVTRVYTMRCLSSNEDYISDFNRTGWHNTFHAPPVIKDIESLEDGIKVTWDREKDAQDYSLYRRSGSSSWTLIVKTGASSFTDKSVSAGVKYTYTLRMVTSDGKSFMSGHNSGKTITFVKVPSIKSIDNSADGAVISWDKVKGADYYRIYYKGKNGGWTRLASKYTTEFTDTSVKDGETRVYTLRCLNENGDFVSGFNTEGWSNKFYSAPKITSISYSNGAVNISWDKKEGIAAYRLYRKTIGGSFSRVSDSITGNTYSDRTAAKDRAYAYTLRYLDADGKLVSGFISNVRYYINGKLANGNVSQNGTYGFKDGYLLTGLNRVNGKLYYYNSEGRMYRDTIVGNSSMGYYYIDEDGVCCESKEMRLAAEFMEKYCKGSTLKDKMEYGFLYMANNYPYVRVYNDAPDDESDIPAFAIECFTEKQGTCYRYAAAFACIAKIAGYRSRFSYGISGSLLHGWTEVYVDGEWLMCDVDAQLPSYGYSDYAPYMMEYHIWTLDKYWSSELTLKDGKAVWGSIRYY